MNRAEAIFWCLCFATALDGFVRADDDARKLKGSNDTLQYDICRGIKLQVANGEARITVGMSALINGNEVEKKSTGRLKFKGTLQKIGMAMMMAPLMIQLMSLPVNLATIKMNLLRSFFVGKIALLLILYNMIKNSQKSEVVVVHRPEYHKHYYHSYHQPEDDDDSGWWKR